MGEHALAREGERLRASVAVGLVVCVRDKASGIGGATVVLLPAEPSASAEEGGFVSNSMRLGNLALEHLVTAIHKDGGRRERCEVMVFGAAACDGALAGVAATNRAFIEEYLALEGFAVRRLELGGTRACTVEYDPATGGVTVTHPGRAEMEALVRAEIHLLATADAGQAAEDIELF